MKPKYKFFNNCSYAIDGLRDIWANESSFRIECIIFVALALSLFAWNFGTIVSLFLVFCMVFVLVCECFNSAIERVVDLASPEIHPLAKAAKDAGSAAVMLANCFCGTAWMLAIVWEIL